MMRARSDSACARASAVQFFGISRRKHDARAASPEFLRHGQAQSTGRSGNQNDFAAQVGSATPYRSTECDGCQSGCTGHGNASNRRSADKDPSRILGRSREKPRLTFGKEPRVGPIQFGFWLYFNVGR